MGDVVLPSNISTLTDEQVFQILGAVPPSTTVSNLLGGSF
jgi:hypothetical protein